MLLACDAADLGMSDTCCCCGGSASLGGTQDPIPGSVPALRYCCVECHDDWEDYLAREAERRASDWCPSCGFDNHEHAEDCPTRAEIPTVQHGRVGPTHGQEQDR